MTRMITPEAAQMSARQKDPMASARQARLAAIVMAGTMVIWLGLQAIGREMGWPPRFALLIDLAAIAGFLWGLVTTYQIWRKRRA